MSTVDLDRPPSLPRMSWYSPNFYSLAATRLHDLAGDLRAIMREHIPPEIKADLAEAERALERAAARAETEH